MQDEQRVTIRDVGRVLLWVCAFFGALHLIGEVRSMLTGRSTYTQRVTSSDGKECEIRIEHDGPSHRLVIQKDATQEVYEWEDPVEPRADGRY